ASALMAAGTTAAPSAGPGLLPNTRFARPSAVNTSCQSMPRQSAAGSIRHSRAPNTGLGLSSRSSIAAVLREFEYVPRLAGERAAERVQSRKAHGLGLAGLEHGEVCQRDADFFRQLREAHLTLG